MTCVAGIAHRGRVYLLGDSAVTTGDELSGSAVPKVRRCGGYCYGVSGDCRVCDVAVRWSLPRWDGSSPEEWAVDVLAPTIRQRMRDCGERSADLEILLGIGGVLLCLDSDLATTMPRWGYHAIGSGASVAIGALAATAGLQPRARLRAALKAASRHCSASVGPPWRGVSA